MWPGVTKWDPFLKIHFSSIYRHKKGNLRFAYEVNTSKTCINQDLYKLFHEYRPNQFDFRPDWQFMNSSKALIKWLWVIYGQYLNNEVVSKIIFTANIDTNQF